MDAKAAKTPSTKAEHSQESPDVSRRGASGGAYAGLLKMQQAAGNRAFTHWLESSAGALPPVDVDASGKSPDLPGDAWAAARGSQIVGAQGAFDGEQGKARLAHEIAHLLQQRASGLPRGNLDEIEGDADRFSNLAMSGQRAAVRYAAPLGWAYDKKRPNKQTVRKGDRVASMTVYKDSKAVVVTMQSGDEFAYTFTQLKLPEDRTSYTASVKGGKITVDVPGETVLYISGSRDLPNPAGLPYPSSFPLTVREKGASFGSGGGKGQGSGGKQSGDKGSGKKKTEDGTSDGGKVGGEEKPKDVAPVTPGATTTTPNPDKQPTATEPIPGDNAPPPPEVKAPVITITDLKQIEELKKRGLIPAETADQIKAKLEKQEQLTFDEAIKLIDALNQVAAPPKGDKPEPGKESWLKWAKYVMENKDKISGRTKTGAGGLTVDEVKEIIKKHNEYVGVVDAPKAPEGKKKNFDPQVRKSWNSLPDWQKQVWKDYLKRFPDSFSEDSGRNDVHLRDSDLFAMAMRMSADYVPEGGREAFHQLVNDPIFIGGTLIGIGLYIAAWLAPEPLFSKATAATITLALLGLFTVSEIRNLAVAWMRLDGEASKARSMADLEVAAEHFGKALGGTILRVLVTLATLIAGKAIGSLKPPSGGGFGVAEPATANGAPLPEGFGLEPVPARAPATASAGELSIKITRSGAIEILGPTVGSARVAAGSGSGGSGSGEPSKEGGGKPKTETLEEFQKRGGQIKKLEPGPKPKEGPSAQPKARDELGAAKEALGEGPEANAVQEKATPGGAPQPAEFQRGNWVHENAELLVKDTKLPRGLDPEVTVETPEGAEIRLDRVDWKKGTFYEIRPDTPKQIADMNAKLPGRVRAMNERYRGQLPKGKASWDGKIVTYNKAEVVEALKNMGKTEAEATAILKEFGFD